MSGWVARARVVAALVLTLGVMSCSRSGEGEPAAPVDPAAPPAAGEAVACLAPPLPEGWRVSVESDFEAPPEGAGGAGMPMLMNTVQLTGEAARYDKDPSTPLGNLMIKARVNRSAIGPITGEHRAAAERQMALGHWRRLRQPAIHADGYITYDAPIPEINLQLLQLVNEMDDSNGNCGRGDCRMFVIDNVRGVTLDIDMSDQLLASLPEIVRDLQPVAAHVILNCGMEQF